MFPLQLLNPLSIFVSLLTMTGVAVHDTNVDKAITTAYQKYSIVTSDVKAPGNDPHTHSERGSLSQAIRDLKATNPRVQPRNEDKKHLLPKHVARGHHAFDNYNLPIV